MQQKELGIHIHEEWKGMTQPVGLVVEPVVLDRLGIFPERNISLISDLQRRLEALFGDHLEGDDFCSAVFSFKEFCKEVLDWQDTDLLKPEELFSNQNNDEISVFLEDYEEILKPDWIIPDFSETKNEKAIQILVKELEIGTPFDQLIKNPEKKKQWEATAHQRFERLLKETQNSIGILWNGLALRLIYAPRGESSGHITFPLEPMLTVDGRPMIAALEMLLGTDRLFEGGASNHRLLTLMEQSRKEQNEVSTRLSEQVLEALWILVKGFDEAEQKSKEFGQTILYDLEIKDPAQIYGGLITVLLRLVFLLYSEDEELMPIDSIYAENYSVIRLAAKLRQDRSNFQGAMNTRYGAWASLLSLFRLVFDGGGPNQDYLPARHGELFDPNNYPFLEGRDQNNNSEKILLKNIPLISDDVVEKVLSKLLILDGQLLSYRSLDVEQIGSVYEGIMGFTVERTDKECVGISYRPPKEKISITFVFEIDEFLSKPGSKRDKWLNEKAGIDLKLSNKIKNSLSNSSSLDEICQALDNKLSKHTPRGLRSGSLYLQPTIERRRSGSHYTPRTLTEPIVEEGLRPWLESVNYKPQAKQILKLKICDPAMGSGAFLVASCRLLGNYLVEAWNREGLPEEYNKTFDKDIYARRLVAQNCLYGVDKNPFAVSLAKISLWLVTLNKELPFTFVDHSIKCGDSLVGYSIKDIQKVLKNIQLNLLNSNQYFINNLGYERAKNFSNDSRDDSSYINKELLLRNYSEKIKYLVNAGNILVAAFFNEKNNKDRKTKENYYISLLDNELNEKNITLNQLVEKLFVGEKSIKPFHWDLEFPEVFDNDNRGFDLIVGNPPYAGNTTLVKSYPKTIHGWFKNIHPSSGGQCDLVAHFFRRSFDLLKEGGVFGLIATNTIAEGDTRDSGLKWICQNNGNIYSARKKYRWPGVASVIVSTVHTIKGTYSGKKSLNGRIVNFISSFLTENGTNENPKVLTINLNRSFVGSFLYGKGFIFDDSSAADEETSGVPSPLKTYKRLIENKKNMEVIFPYIGGDEVSSKPDHSHHRYVIDFRDLSFEKCNEEYKEVLDLLEVKMKPYRNKLNPDGSFKLSAPLPQKWWLHARIRPALYEAISTLKRVLVCTQTSKYTTFVFLESKKVFDQKLCVFSLDKYFQFSICQSNFYLLWSYFFGTTLGGSHVYNSVDCFENFPFPDFMFSLNEIDEKSKLCVEKLEVLGSQFYQLRSKIMIESNIGITKLYNKFHSPKFQSEDICELRRLQESIDNEILNYYGWSDLCCSFGFNLDSLDLEIDNNNLVISDQINKFLYDGQIFIQDIGKASSFDYEIKFLINNNKQIPWEYSWSNNIKEKILARLMDLNKQKFLEEKPRNILINKDNYKDSSINNLNNKKQENQLGLGL